MLTRLTEAEFDRYAPWAYDLAMTAEHASYPTWMDGIKTREDFMVRARRSFTDEEVLLFRHDGEVRGWIQWFAIPAENYAMTVSFLVEDHVEAAAREFVAHVAQTNPGVTLDIGLDGDNKQAVAALDIGLDGDNKQAVAALESCGFTLLESAVNHTIFFDRYQPVAVPEGVALMQPGEEADFRRLHNNPDMYWNAERILADLPNWKVYLHRQKGAAVAALVCRAEEWPEVFSVEFDGEAFRLDSYRAMLAACLNDLQAAGRRYMTYFEEDECALPILAELGFERVGRYLAYRKELKEE